MRFPLHSGRGGRRLAPRYGTTVKKISHRRGKGRLHCFQDIPARSVSRPTIGWTTVRVPASGDALGALDLSLMPALATPPQLSQRNGVTEPQSSRVAEIQKVPRGSERTEATDGKRLSIYCHTVEEAICLAIERGVKRHAKLNLGRALLNYRMTTGKQPSEEEAIKSFNLWWVRVKSLLPKSADYDIWMMDFLITYYEAEFPIGFDAVDLALERAAFNPDRPECGRFKNTSVKRLVNVCYELQKLNHPRNFFISTRKAAYVMSIPDPRVAGRLLKALDKMKVLHIEKLGGTRSQKATRFSYVNFQP